MPKTPRGGNSHQRATAKNAGTVTGQAKSGAGAAIVRIDVLGALGIMLAIVVPVVGFPELPLLWQLVLCLIGFILAVVLVWRWEYPSRLGRCVLVVSAVLVYGTLIFVPIHREYERESSAHFSFKDSSSLSWSRKAILSHDLSGFEHYLASLGIEIPGSVPPIAITDSSGWSREDMSVSFERDNIDNAAIVGTKDAATGLIVHVQRPAQLNFGKDQVGQRESITTIYGDYLITLLAGKSGSVVAWNSGFGYSCYFVHSYWDEPPQKSGVPCSLFWEIRNKLGRAFADKLAAAALNSLEGDRPEAHTDPSSSAYRSIMIGDSMIDSQCEKWRDIRQSLVAAGIGQLNQESVNAFFPVTSVSVDCLTKFIQN